LTAKEEESSEEEPKDDEDRPPFEEPRSQRRIQEESPATRAALDSSPIFYHQSQLSISPSGSPKPSEVIGGAPIAQMTSAIPMPKRRRGPQKV